MGYRTLQPSRQENKTDDRHGRKSVLANKPTLILSTVELRKLAINFPIFAVLDTFMSIPATTLYWRKEYCRPNKMVLHHKGDLLMIFFPNVIVLKTVVPTFSKII